eukprot:TRINITY_DN41491_c0_g1_i1.p1 TRINITY_DN41491_c0_g1~~TRINITY_DN41491_c0_g1_i1.p1  ORF type:complete len:496 (-),score=105.93 TRINITY_DN41491_c0_g1_i1:195-1682(-)
MSKYGKLSRSDGHSKWFLQKTLLEHDSSMDHPWMQMIYKQSFSVKQYAAWLARNHAVFAKMEKQMEVSKEPLSIVHDSALNRTDTLEVDLARLLGSDWKNEAAEMVATSAATKQYLEKLEADSASSWLMLAHHFLQYNAVLSGGAYLGEMVSQKLCVPHGAPGVKFYAFDGVSSGKESARVQRYIRDFDTIGITDEDRDEMLVAMKRIYKDTEALMTECFDLNPVKGIGYEAAKASGEAAPPPPCAEQLELDFADLQNYRGENGARILISLDGQLLDVSSGRELYGPGGGYSILSGHDVSKCLATMSLEPSHLDDVSWKPETAEDKEALKNWLERLKAKYPVAGKLKPGSVPPASDDATSSEGLRKRQTGTSAEASASGSSEAPAAEGEKCPISGKVGTCPMASIMGLAGASPPKEETQAATSSANGTKAGGAFMSGKSLVASVEKTNSSEESFLWRLCPLHWDDKTIKMVIAIAITSWMSGVFVGWNLRKQLVS